MATLHLSDEQCQETADIFLRNGGNYSACAAELNLARSTFQNRVKRASERGFFGFAPVLPGFVVSETSVQSDATGHVQKQWIRQKREPGGAFQIPDGHLVKGVSALVDPEGRTLAQWIKTREDAANQERLIDVIKAAFDGYEGHAKPTPSPRVADKDLATVYVIGDHHLGMYAWAKETGDADYNLQIGAKALRDAMHDLVAQAPKSDTGVVLGLGDFIHADNQANRTERSGNSLDVDTRYAKVLQLGVELLISCVELAAQRHAKVIVRCLPGNHDPHTALALSVALARFFHASKRIEIDCSPGPFFQWRFGDVFLCANHGDRIKPADMPGIMAARWPADWGNSKHRYAYFGHVHHRSIGGGETHGVIWETFQCLAPKDAWHAAEGYTAGRSMVAITLHKKHGEKYRHVTRPAY